MPVNRNTGKADRCNLPEADVVQFSMSQMEKRKGGQALLGHGHRVDMPEALGSRRSPSTMPLFLDSLSPHSPVATPESPTLITASESPAPPTASNSPAPAAANSDFYVEVPSLPKPTSQLPPASQAASPAANVFPAAAVSPAAFSPATVAPLVTSRQGRSPDLGYVDFRMTKH
jgi:hypothetical protein